MKKSPNQFHDKIYYNTNVTKSNSIQVDNFAPNFLLGASQNGFNFMIAFDHKLIFSDHEHHKVGHKYLLRLSITPPREFIKLINLLE